MVASLRTIEIACTVVRETAQAWLINDGVMDAWLPKSVTTLTEQRDGTVLAEIPTRMAEAKGLV